MYRFRGDARIQYTSNEYASRRPIRRHPEVAGSRFRLSGFCVTGPGGIGKTALALEVARRVLDRFDDGVWFVELASLVDSDVIPSAIAGILGLRLESRNNLL